METGVITNAQITASSSYNMQSVGPHNARLNRDDNGGAWCPLSQLSAKTSGTEWIEVDLKDFHVITAISTQGRFGNGMGAEFVEEYWLEYSRDNGLTWKRFRERHNAGDDEVSWLPLFRSQQIDNTLITENIGKLGHIHTTPSESVPASGGRESHSHRSLCCLPANVVPSIRTVRLSAPTPPADCVCHARWCERQLVW